MHYISSDNIYFRSLEKTDLDKTHEWLHDSIIADKVGVSIPFSKSQQEKWFESMDTDKTKIVFAVCLIKNDLHIGNVSIDQIDFKHRNARLSIFIANLENRKKGLGSECIALLKDYCFNALNLHKIYCKTDADDEKVLAFYKKNDFFIEGELIEHEFKKGRFVNKTIFACLNKLNNF